MLPVFLPGLYSSGFLYSSCVPWSICCLSSFLVYMLLVIYILAVFHGLYACCLPSWSIGFGFSIFYLRSLVYMVPVFLPGLYSSGFLYSSCVPWSIYSSGFLYSSCVPWSICWLSSSLVYMLLVFYILAVFHGLYVGCLPSWSICFWFSIF